MSSIPKQQKAVFVPGVNKPTEIKDRPVPHPKDDEILIKMTATAINPVDWKIRDKGYFKEKFPAVIGSDGAGTVAQLGSNVKDFKEGDRVFFQGIITTDDNSTFQQYAVMPAELCGHTPESISDDEASGISLATMANIAGLYTADGADVKPHPWEKGGDRAGEGKSIVILGGSSSVGQYAIQLARLNGFSNIVTASSKSHHDHLKKLGAHSVLDRNEAQVSDYVNTVKSAGYPLGIVIDSISEADTGVLGVEILKGVNPDGVPSDAAGIDNSTVILYLQPDEKVHEAAKNAGPKAAIKVKNVWGVGSAPYLRSQAVNVMKALGGEDGWIARKQFHPNRIIVIDGGLANVEEGLARNKKGVSGQKLILKPQE